MIAEPSQQVMQVPIDYVESLLGRILDKDLEIISLRSELDAKSSRKSKMDSRAVTARRTLQLLANGSTRSLDMQLILRKSPSTMSQVLTGLVKQGYCVAEGDKALRRFIITQAGLDALTSMQEQPCSPQA